MKNKFPIYFISILSIGGIVGIVTELYCDPFPSLLVGVGLAWPIATILSILLLRKKSALFPSKPSTILNVILICITMVLFPLSLKPPEGKYIFNLEIDTHFSEGYTESKFQQVSANMTQADITALLGEPLSKQNVANQIEFDELWYYSGDGACPWYDFAWVRKQVHFNKGLVVGTYTGWSCD